MKEEQYLIYAYEILSLKGEVELPFLPVDEYTEFLETKGYELDNDPIETNGWQVDFWIQYTHPELKTIHIEGSLFHGGNKWYYENS